MKALFSNLGVKLAGVALLLLPFFVSPFAATQDAQLQGAKLLAVFLLGNFVFALFLARGLHWIIGLLHFGIAFSAWATGFGTMQLFPFVFWSAALVFSLWFVRLPRCSRNLLWRMLLIGATLSAVHGLVQAVGLETVIRDHVTSLLPATKPFFLHYAPGIEEQHLPIGYFGQHTKFGAFLAAMVPLAICFSGALSPITVLLSLVILFTGSAFSIAAALAGALVCLRWSGRHGREYAATAGLSFLFLGVVALAALPRVEFLFPHGRFQVWEQTVSAWWNGPYRLMGYGLGSFGSPEAPSKVVENGTEYMVQESFFSKNFESQQLRAQHGNFAQTHNDYLQVVFEMGFFGIFLLGIALFGFGRAFYRRWWRGENDISRDLYVPLEVRASQGALVALMVNAIGNFPFQLAPHFLIGLLSFVILLIDDEEAATI